jgi:hypothetical protein
MAVHRRSVPPPAHRQTNGGGQHHHQCFISVVFVFDANFADTSVYVQ